MGSCDHGLLSCNVEVSPCSFIPPFGVFDKRRNGAVKRDGMRKTPPGEIRTKIQDPPLPSPASMTPLPSNSKAIGTCSELLLVLAHESYMVCQKGLD